MTVVSALVDLQGRAHGRAVELSRGLILADDGQEGVVVAEPAAEPRAAGSGTEEVTGNGKRLEERPLSTSLSQGWDGCRMTVRHYDGIWCCSRYAWLCTARA